MRAPHRQVLLCTSTHGMCYMCTKALPLPQIPHGDSYSHLRMRIPGYPIGLALAANTCNTDYSPPPLKSATLTNHVTPLHTGLVDSKCNGNVN